MEDRTEEDARFPLLAQRLSAAREALGYTQSGVAAAVPCGFRSWQDYEAGKRVPGAQVVAGLVRLGVNANWLLAGEGPMLLRELGASSATAADLQHLKAVWLGVEEALDELDATMAPDKKLDLVFSLYELTSEAGKPPQRATILRLVRSAA